MFGKVRFPGAPLPSKGYCLGSERVRKKKSYQELPIIPDKRYFTISEVSKLCSLEAYVLRYWEQEFTQLKPIKRKGNRRFYQFSDILLIRQIRQLLYSDGFTIEGARSQLANMENPISQSIKLNETIKKMIAELESVLQNLQSDMTHLEA